MYFIFGALLQKLSNPFVDSVVVLQALGGKNVKAYLCLRLEGVV